MNICPRCGQLIRVDEISVRYNGELYHGRCYTKMDIQPGDPGLLYNQIGGTRQ